MLTTWTTSAPAGSGIATLAATTVTVAPRATAVSASAYPCRPDDRLPRNRTGSRYSRVPPAETTTCLPARSCGRDSRTLRQAEKISSGSGRRPLPVSTPVSRPDAGSSTTMPRSRNVSTLVRVAAFSHISVCMAGAITTGHRAVSSVFVRRSSARPCAALASRLAVAGATTTRSACWPSRTCGTSWTSWKTSVRTGRPDSASHVGAPTNFSAASVGTTVTWWPDSVNRRTSEAAL